MTTPNHPIYYLQEYLVDSSNSSAQVVPSNDPGTTSAGNVYFSQDHSHCNGQSSDPPFAKRKSFADNYYLQTFSQGEGPYQPNYSKPYQTVPNISQNHDTQHSVTPEDSTLEYNPSIVSGNMQYGNAFLEPIGVAVANERTNIKREHPSSTGPRVGNFLVANTSGTFLNAQPSEIHEIKKPKIQTVFWEDQNTTCYQVTANGYTVSRRLDNNYINGTKLLNVIGMTRGKRDGILKTEKNKAVVKVGSINLKGVWIPFDRAYEIARNEGVDEILFPLFLKDFESYFAKVGHKLRSNPSSSVKPEIVHKPKPDFTKQDHHRSEKQNQVQFYSFRKSGGGQLDSTFRQQYFMTNS